MAIHAGPGKIRCASATQFLIDRFKPQVIIDSGGAGSLTQEASIFDLVCAEFVYEYDICSFDDFSHLKEDLTSSTILKILSRDEKNLLHQFKEHIEKERRVKLIFGNIACGEKNVGKKSFKQKLNTHFRATACNWETSAVLKTAELNNVITFSFRVITDHSDERMPEDLKANWEKGCIILYHVMEIFLTKNWLYQMLKNLK